MPARIQTPPPPSGSRPMRANLLLLLASGVAGLLLAEGVLALLDLPARHRPHDKPPQFQPLPDTGYLYVSLPSREIRFVYDSNPRGYFLSDNSVVHTTNALGFRGPEFIPDKPAFVVRLLFLGDSFTFGEGVRDSDTYVQRFAELAASADACPGRSVETINLGVGGYNTEQEAALLRDLGTSLSPDRIVVGYTLGDAEPTLFIHGPDGNLVRRDREATVPEDLGSPDVPPPLGLFRLGRLAFFAWHDYRLTADTVAYYRGLYRPDGPDWPRTTRALAEIARLGREKRIPVVVMVFPILFRLHSGYPFLEIHRQVVREVEKEGMVALDLYPLFQGSSAADLWVHPADHHPNEMAHRLVAQRLLDFLRSPAAGEARLR